MTRFTFLFFILTLSAFHVDAQNHEITGEVLSEDNGAVEGLHVSNLTQNINTTTDAEGKFYIDVAVNDVLQVSSIQYKKVSLVLSETHIKNKRVVLYLEIQVNELAEVRIGRILTGNLYDDIQTTEVERPLDFYVVGIPGYTGKRKTKSERRLYEAQSFSLLPINPILNGLSGRTKMLKKRVALEKNTDAMFRLKDKLGRTFFESYPLEASKQMEFFYFCAEDEDFNRLTSGSDLEAFDFMVKKYQDFQHNLKK